MDLMSILRIAMRALARNKLRSSLTMLGIIIGVGAVIAMVGVGSGAQQQVQQQIAAMGSNILFVSNGTEPQYFDIRTWPVQSGTVFTQNDVDTATDVAVIGESVRKNLFGATDPIGQTI